MEMVKRLRQKHHSFLLTANRIFSAHGISKIYSKSNLLQGNSFHSTLRLYLPAWFLSLGGVMSNCRTFLRISFHPPKVWFQPVHSTATEAEKIGMPVEDSNHCENHFSSHVKIFSA